MKMILQALSLVDPQDTSSHSTSSDFLVQSKTGTGKTLAYLFAIVETLLRTPPTGVGALIIAPTRELALQIQREAQMLLTHQSLEIIALVGGISKREDKINLRRHKPHILIGTAGRLLYHLEETYFFTSLFENLQILVLDEADRLLELGHRLATQKLLSYLPKKRQTFLFSATLSKQMNELIQQACKADYQFLDCIASTNPTQLLLHQQAILHPAEATLTVLYNILYGEIQKHRYSYKIIVFFQTSRLTAFFSAFFQQQFRMAVYEIHSRRDSTTRLSLSLKFSKDSTGILFASDLCARGMDFPNISLVIQVGAPLNFEQYLHRIGRTARLGGRKFG
ncbi:DEAD/DEAH box helicase domain-containing protein [Cardiosporidium cionae]|uniref:ATP-dependent RNA helicase n=1 Tax=Cardiosporidium cionae TaxID=476202 RepID=A0ABQ7JCS7_9APIC|nr:DEAD/DEAH box helicase domain-containing protein [Cardiosporidium cionae]|eukprot:KAF8821795.1 DEAD/DEAH box helicase domain-containing protein [Cardiosporidium cionae]